MSPREPQDGDGPGWETREVYQRRFDEARRAGLSLNQAARFAESGIDVGQLRKLVSAGCPARLIARIVT